MPVNLADSFHFLRYSSIKFFYDIIATNLYRKLLEGLSEELSIISCIDLIGFIEVTDEPIVFRRICTGYKKCIWHCFLIVIF